MEIEGATFNISSSLVMKICFGDDYCVPTITLCGPQQLILSLQKWKKLTEESKSILLAIEGKSEESEWCLGGYFYVTILNNIVDIRKRNKVGEDFIDSNQGLLLTYSDFRQLMKLTNIVEQLVPELVNLRPCWEGDDHYNQIGALMCPECNPDEYLNWLE
ncbi:hypothetical protein DPMN_188177 [Dreissena polymorpha]|uniref:Uncharacterized protein n=1 Tax=Dreissena polymorpha TaxID=45954 RepID=A0A9D4IB40_DREPO|nr:hypothetical protein DPMN_188177 [Dreissena polymorpha]